MIQGLCCLSCQPAADMIGWELHGCLCSKHVRALPHVLELDLPRRFYDFNAFVSLPLSPFHPGLRSAFDQWRSEVLADPRHASWGVDESIFVESQVRSGVLCACCPHYSPNPRSSSWALCLCQPHPFLQQLHVTLVMLKLYSGEWMSCGSAGTG